MANAQKWFWGEIPCSRKHLQLPRPAVLAAQDFREAGADDAAELGGFQFVEAAAVDAAFRRQGALVDGAQSGEHF